VSCGAGVGTITLAAAAIGREVMAWDARVRYEELLAESISINGFEAKVRLNDNGVSCHDLSNVQAPVGAVAIGASANAADILFGAASLLESRPPATILIDLRGASVVSKLKLAQQRTVILPRRLPDLFRQLGAWGYVSMFHAGRACESDMGDWKLQPTSSLGKRADSTVYNTEDDSLLTPSWCVVCPGKLGNFGEFITNLEHHGGMESVIFFHRSAGVDDSAVWCSALGDDK